MSPLEGVLLGVIQGLTEFLPVSSSGHLVIVQSFIKGFHQPGVLFDVMLHCGTLLAVLFFFRRTIYDILRSLLPKRWRGSTDDDLAATGRKMALLIIVATGITATFGVLFEHEIRDLFESVDIVAAMLIITGLLLYLSDRKVGGDKKDEELGLADSAIIGIAQCFALIPGISRSGATITFGIFRGLRGETAARFSFLLSIPAIAGATVFELRYAGSATTDEMAVYFIGMTAAAVTGFFTLKLLFFIINKRRLSIFAYYCWFVGISVLMMRTIRF
ncbi:MAG: undecaprenyl-diphosphate phosphatase [Syntrophobacterales bacterium]|nr:MAG: undecaprenyl-diphosphate phosphatase [Syntrophobacterales bacterium]